VAGKPPDPGPHRVTHTPPLVGIVMGSKSDWPVLQHAAEMLEALGVAYEAKIVSAHRTPKRLYDYASGAQARGLKVIIAGAGGAAHLPGMAAAMTVLPVLGVPVATTALQGLDSLLSMVQMPGGVPVGTLAIGKAGAINAGLLAAAILALSDPELTDRVKAYREAQTAAVPDAPEA
jgi:5-(carboxyamino)imidazole ribonucleotide mutase